MAQEQGSYITNPVRRTSVTLTDAQIKAAPITPVRLVAAPADDKLILILEAIFEFDITAAYTLSTAAPITSATTINLIFGESDVDNSATDSTIPGDDVLIPIGLNVFISEGFGVGSSPFPTDEMVGEAISFAISAENDLALIGGDADNTITITVLYIEI